MFNYSNHRCATFFKLRNGRWQVPGEALLLNRDNQHIAHIRPRPFWGGHLWPVSAHEGCIYIYIYIWLRWLILNPWNLFIRPFCTIFWKPSRVLLGRELFSYLLTGLLKDLLTDENFTAYEATYRDWLQNVTLLLPSTENTTAANLRMPQQSRTRIQIDHVTSSFIFCDLGLAGEM